MNAPGAAWLAEARQSRALKGIACMTLAAALSAGITAIARHVSTEIHPLEVTFFRCAFGALFLLPIAIRIGPSVLRTQRMGLLATRGGLSIIVMVLYFWGVGLTPIAKATAIHFSAPLFATLLAVVLLGEPLRGRRLGALAIGFAGTLIVLRPGLVEMDLGALLMLGSAFFWGVTMIVIKIAARTEAAITITVYISIFQTLFSIPVAIPVWETPSPEMLGWLALMGLCGSSTQYFFAQSFRYADVTAVLPLDFTRMIWVAIIGYFVFAEVPDLWTWIGAAVIFGAALAIAYREQTARREPEPERTPTDVR